MTFDPLEDPGDAESVSELYVATVRGRRADELSSLQQTSPEIFERRSGRAGRRDRSMDQAA